MDNVYEINSFLSLSVTCKEPEIKKKKKNDLFKKQVRIYVLK